MAVNQKGVLSVWQPGKTGNLKRKGDFSPFFGLYAQKMNDNMQDIRVIPPSPGSCPICATIHDPKEPHDRDSLYYQNRFRKKHKRFPTWEDAMAHCEESVKKDFRKRLARRGIIIKENKEGV